MSRSPVSARVRYEVLRRDGFRCKYCGATPGEAELTVDHVIPVALGGGHGPENLRTACRPCNQGKASVPADAPLVQEVSRDAERWAAAMQQAADEQMADRRALRERLQQFQAEWTSWRFGDRPADLPDGWQVAITSYVAAGIDQEAFAEATAIAMRKRLDGPEVRFKYFCGIVRRWLTERSDRAREILGLDTTPADRSPSPTPAADEPQADILAVEWDAGEPELVDPVQGRPILALRHPRRVLVRDRDGIVEEWDVPEGRAGEFAWGYAGSGPLNTAWTLLLETVWPELYAELTARVSFRARPELGMEPEVLGDPYTEPALLLSGELIAHLDETREYDIDLHGLALWMDDHLLSEIDAACERCPDDRDRIERIMQGLLTPPRPALEALRALATEIRAPSATTG